MTALIAVLGGIAYIRPSDAESLKKAKPRATKALPGVKPGLTLPAPSKLGELPTLVEVPGYPDLPGPDDDLAGPPVEPSSCLAQVPGLYSRVPIDVVTAGGTFPVYMTRTAWDLFTDAVLELLENERATPAVVAREALQQVMSELAPDDDVDCWDLPHDQWTTAEMWLFASAGIVVDAIMLQEYGVVYQGSDEPFVNRNELGLPGVGDVNLAPDQVVETIARADDEVDDERVFLASLSRDSYEVLGEFRGVDVAPRRGDAHGFEAGQRRRIPATELEVMRVFPRDPGAPTGPVGPQRPGAGTPGSNLFYSPTPNVVIWTGDRFPEEGDLILREYFMALGIDRVIVYMGDERMPGDQSLQQSVLSWGMQHPGTGFVVLDDQQLGDDTPAATLDPRASALQPYMILQQDWDPSASYPSPQGTLQGAYTLTRTHTSVQPDAVLNLIRRYTA